MNNFTIGADKQKQLEERMLRLGIREADIIEKFIHSSGKGGQNLNKVSTCVYIKHLPTGIEIKCQLERSQAMNRFFARRMLSDKVESKILGRLSDEQRRIEKIRRQKRKRSRRAKAKLRILKEHRSDKKELRSKIQDYGQG